MTDQPTLPGPVARGPASAATDQAPFLSSGAAMEREQAWLSERSTLTPTPTVRSRRRTKEAPEVNWRYMHHVVVLVSCVFLGALVAVHLGQDVNWDFFNYHYYDGYAILTGAWQKNIAPAQLQTYLNPSLDIATYLMYSHLPPIVVGAVLGGFQGLAFWLVYEITWVVFARHAMAMRTILALGCAALAFYSPSSLGELGSSMGDLTVSVPVLAGILLLLRSLHVRAHALTIVAVARLLLGLAVGAKLTVLIYVIPAYLTLGITVGSGWLKRIVVLSGSLAVGALALMGYWMTDLVRTYGSPLFPYFNMVFKSPYALPVSVVDPRFFPQSHKQWLFLPFYLTKDTVLRVQEIPFQDLTFAIAYVLLAVAVVVGLIRLAGMLPAFILARPANGVRASQRWVRQISQSWRVSVASIASENLIPLRITLLVILGWILWERMFSIYRYVETLDLLVPIVICVLVGWIARQRAVQLGLILVLFGWACAAMSPSDWGRIPWSNAPFSVSAPTLPDPQHSVVVIVSGAPMSYLVPDFPRHVRFVSFDNNLNGVVSPLFTNKELAVIGDNAGPTYFMTDAASYVREAAYFHTVTGLTVNEKSCAPIKGAMSPTLFCQVTR